MFETCVIFSRRAFTHVPPSFSHYMNLLLPACFAPQRRLLLGFSATILVFLLSVILPISSFAQVQTSSTAERPLRDAANRADYLVITPEQFLPDIDSYVRWRTSSTATHKGMRTFVATLGDINKEFLDRTKPQGQAEAIRSFISHTLQNWQNPKPQYVLLIGSTTVLPAYRIKVTDFEFSQPPYILNEDSIPMDNWYIVNKHIEEFNTRPQAKIGRIPGRTGTEIRRVLQKIRTFEEYGNWMNYNRADRFTSIIDAQDAEMFDEWRSSIFDYLEATTKTTVTTATLSYRSIANTLGAKQKTMQAINAGSPCLLYFGHGAPEKWSTFAIVTTDDVWNSFARDGRPFMFASLGCSQNYGIPSKLSIVESMMLLDNGGAVSSLASSGYSNGSNGRYFLTVYFSELFKNPGMDIGTAILRTSENVFGNLALIPQDDIYRRFSLLGDPAMVPFPRFLTSVKNETKQAAEALQLSLSPNPSDGYTALRYTLPAASRVRVEVLTMLGQTILTQETTQAAGNHALELTTAAMPAGVYLCRLSAGSLAATTMLRVVR